MAIQDLVASCTRGSLRCLRNRHPGARPFPDHALRAGSAVDGVGWGAPARQHPSCLQPRFFDSGVVTNPARYETGHIALDDIFISYASKDRPTTLRLAEALEARGWSIWWDDRSLYGGQRFKHIIEEAILAAKIVIVIWSQNSIDLNWVRAEASHGLDEKKLLLPRIGMPTFPLRFRNIPTTGLRFGPIRPKRSYSKGFSKP